MVGCKYQLAKWGLHQSKPETKTRNDYSWITTIRLWSEENGISPKNEHFRVSGPGIGMLGQLAVGHACATC